MNLKNSVNEYLENVKLKYSNGTYRYYESHLNDVMKFCEFKGFNSVKKLANMKFYNDYINWNKNKNVVNSTINKRLKSIEQLLKYNSINYRFSKLKETKHTFKLICEDDLKKIMNYIYNLSEDNNYNLNYKLVVMILLETGVRANELINIKKCNIDFNDRSILLKTTKTSEDRYVFISSEYTYNLIIKNLSLNSGSEFLFYNWNSNSYMNFNNFESIIKNLKRNCNIKQLSPHMFRHTFCTLLINNGCPTSIVMRLMGHKSLKTTERYIHQDNNLIKQQFKKFFNLI